MSAGFTPGPWTVCPSDSSFYALISANADHHGEYKNGGVYVARVMGQDKAANAGLISAAPELYGACNALLGLIKLLAANHETPPELLRILTENHRLAEAENALAKARGEQVQA